MDTRNNNDLSEMERIMGSRFKESKRVTDDIFNPPAAKMPEKPDSKTTEGKKESRTGIPPIFPIVAEGEINNYKYERADSEKPFAKEQSGKFDPELNELALKEIAEERGISVEELLQSPPDKKLENKVKPMNETNAEDLDLELEELEIKKKEIELRKKAKEKEGTKKKASEPPPKIDTKKKLKDNPILQRMRQKLSLESINPVEVSVEGIIFRMLPPPVSMHPWIFDKLKAAQAFRSEEVLLMTLKNATVCTALVALGAEGLDYQPIAEVLGLSDYVSDMYSMSTDLRELVAQTLWEMIAGQSSLSHLFTLHPDLVVKLYQAYETKFKDSNLVSSLDTQLHKFICPVEGCGEAYDMQTDKPVYCRIHGVQMSDQGNASDLRALPLA